MYGRIFGNCWKCGEQGHREVDCEDSDADASPPSPKPAPAVKISRPTSGLFSSGPAVATTAPAVNICKRTHVSSFFTRPDLADITLKFGTRQFKGHKLVLSINSEYFQKLFFSQFAEHDKKEIELCDDDEAALEFTLAWIYGVKTELELGEWVSEDDPLLCDRIRERFHLFIAADKYRVTDLAEKVAATIEKETRPWGMTVETKSPGLGGITVYMDQLYGVGKDGIPDHLHAIIKPVMEKRHLSLVEESQFCELFIKYPEFAQIFLIEHPSVFQKITNKGGTIPEGFTRILKEVDGLALCMLKAMAEEQKSICCSHLLATLLSDEDFCNLIDDKTDLAIAMLKDVPNNRTSGGFGFGCFRTV